MNIPLPDETTQAPIGKTRSASAFLEVGRVMKEDILLYTGAPPTARFLDIGCGWGRIARHFVDHVEPPGRYVGMDVVGDFVDWCEENIAPVNPAFSFERMDVYNGLYNPDGTQKASEYRFPFEDGSFDVVFLTSVFTHMLAEDVENYLREIRRLLKPDGRCFSTWLLVGHDVVAKSTGVQTAEGQVRYGFGAVLGMLERSGLALVREPVLRRWSADRESPFRSQDLLLLRRAEPGEASALPAYAPPAPPEGTPATLWGGGSVQSFDPVRNALAVLAGRNVEEYRLAEGAAVRANGREADSLAFREGQEAKIRYGEGADGERVAVEVGVDDRPTVSEIAGNIEHVDPGRGLLTLYADRRHITVELAGARVRANGKQAGPEDLKEGQRARVRYVPSATFVSSRDA